MTQKPDLFIHAYQAQVRDEFGTWRACAPTTDRLCEAINAAAQYKAMGYETRIELLVYSWVMATID